MRKLTLLAMTAVAALPCHQSAARNFVVPDGDIASLKVAIQACNSNNETDTIELAVGGTYLLTTPTAVGSPDGLPTIGSDGGRKVTIYGNGAALKRYSAAPMSPKFRLLRIAPGADVAIVGLNFVKGYAPEANRGGAILNEGGTLFLDACTFGGNSAASGGGVYHDGQNGKMLTVVRCFFDRNAAVSGWGGYDGGAISHRLGRLDVSESSFWRNTAGEGGGISSFGPADGVALRVSASTFFLNQAGRGAGAIVSAGQAQIEQSTFSQNEGATGGSALATRSSTGLIVTNSTFDAIGSQPGAAISNDGVLQVGNSLFHTNGFNGVFYNGADATFTSLGYNLCNDAAGGGSGTSPGGLLNAMGDQRNTSAQLDRTLGSVQDNGGPTQTCALFANSPAIDRGRDMGTNGLPTGRDQRRWKRPFLTAGITPPAGGDRSDIGALEVQPAPTGNAADFDADGRPDYALFNSSTGATAIWNLGGGTALRTSPGPALPTGWRLAATADLNRNGRPDYLLNEVSTGKTVVWLVSAPKYAAGDSGGWTWSVSYEGGVFGPTLPPGWALVAGVDFNGDGKPDYLLFNAGTGETAVWYLNANAFVSGSFGPTLPAGWSLVGAADFNANGKPDLVLFNASTRQVVVWLLNGLTHASGIFLPTPPSGWALQGVADINADGKPDEVLFHAATRHTAVWFLNGASYAGWVAGPTLAPGFDLITP